MSKILTRDQILQAADIHTEEISVPEWGGEVLVRGLTGAERDRFEESVIEMKGKSTRVKMENARAKLVAMSVVGEDGKRLFAEADVELLGKKSAAALDRVYQAAARLSGISNEDLDELAKN